MHWMILPYKRYFEFSGRSRRSEYWWFLVFTVLVALVLMLGMFGTAFDTLVSLSEGATPSFEGVGPGFWMCAALLAIFALVTIIPSIALQVRRLHDLNVSGWWYLAYAIGSSVVGLLPQVGEVLEAGITIGFFAWMFFPGTSGANRYGDDPKDPANVEVFA